MGKISPYEIRIERIKSHHDLLSFSSSNLDLQTFLREDAFHHQGQNISVTFLWFYDHYLISYITLLTDRLTLDADLKVFFKSKGIHYNTLPALKIGRLCVADQFQKMGIGRLMVQDAITIGERIGGTLAGCRFLTVDAKENSILFYKKLGFNILKETNNKVTPMLLDLKLSLHD